MKKLINKLFAKLGYTPIQLVTFAIETMQSSIERADRREACLTVEINILRERIKCYERMERQSLAQAQQLFYSRFVEIYRDADGNPFVRKITEDAISRDIDMADCWENESAYWHLADDGKLYPVTCGSFPRPVSAGELDEFYAENPTIIHSQSGTLVANGKTVGHVMYTDH